jgi:ABC-type multidrug transport system ATPase subunit
LSEAADTLVGGAGRKGISGGERRRLSIGCVLVSFPSILVLDEVTTGLDSFTAFQLLSTLSRLAARGRTIILSIHQPRSDAFHLFSRIVLLTRGNLAYAGPTRDCLSHFAALGHEPEDATNPLDFLIDISSLDTRDAAAEESSRARVKRLVDAWRERSADSAKNTAHTQFNSEPDDKSSAENVVAAETMSGKRPNVLRQTIILIPRAMKNMYRAYPELTGHFLQAIVLGVLMGALLPETTIQLIPYLTI